MLSFLLLSFILSYANGSFNLYIDRNEMQRLTGVCSEIHLVSGGVVNAYAINFDMRIPFSINKLHFKWQAMSKRPVHYELMIEYSDVFALLQPSANISNVGRLPVKEETIRIYLPCSSRLSTEVALNIRFTFHTKHTKHNLALVNLKRNKICLKQNAKTHSKHLVSNASLQNLNSPPSLLLAVLLGACAVTASIVSVAFFICLKRRLKIIDLEGSNNNSSLSLRPQQTPMQIPVNNHSNRIYDVSPYATTLVARSQGHIYANLPKTAYGGYENCGLKLTQNYQVAERFL